MKSSFKKFWFYSVICSSILAWGCSKQEVDPLNSENLLSSSNIKPSASTSTIPVPVANWTKLPGLANDIYLSPSGVAYVLGVGREKRGYKLYSWNTALWVNNQPTGGWSYIKTDGVIDMTAPASQDPIIVSESGDIRVLLPTGASYPLKVQGESFFIKAIAIASGNLKLFYTNPVTPHSGSLYILGSERVPGGHPIYRYNKQNYSWERLGTRGAVRLHVDHPTEALWIIDENNAVYSDYAPISSPNPDWRYFPGQATDITTMWASGHDGTLVLGYSPIESQLGGVYWQPIDAVPAQYNWFSIGGIGKRISASGATMFVVAKDNTIWMAPTDFLVFN